MCGIAGFLETTRKLGDRPLRDLAERMGRSLEHRGPDSSGIWTDETCGIALAHRRLAIIDVSPAGHQPMASADGRYVISFNGEFYNHIELRDALSECAKAPAWRGHSDTETILAAIVAWGVEGALDRARGMFAFALWDRQLRCLHLARDRIGEKPLYYGWLGKDFAFASEIKALRRHPSWTGTIDRGALALYMRHGYIPAPHCVFAGLRKLLPGTTLCVAGKDSSLDFSTYWSLPDATRDAARDPFTGSPEEAVDRLHTRLTEAVAEQMISDVPLGAFLSGGIDSSTIAALMQAHSSRPVRTFTIGFHEQEYDEAVHARAIAKHLGTDHTELYVQPKEAIDALALMPRIYDEPFGDPSQVPTFILSRMTAKHVTVALSGDGGDELFGGYTRYAHAQRVFDRVARVPIPVRRAIGAGLKAVSARRWDQLLGAILAAKGKNATHFHPGQKVHKWAEFCSPDPAQVYRQLVSLCNNPGAVVLGGREPSTAFSDPGRQTSDKDLRNYMMSLDLVSYLPDDILVKVDRAAMAVSLETRIPLLDPRIVHFAASLPSAIKMHHGQPKWLLRQVLDRYVPAALVDRPKMGFAIPIGQWLRGPLRAWAEALLEPSRMRAQGMLDHDVVASMWREFLAGDGDAERTIWNILMFQAWMERDMSTSEDGLPTLQTA